MKTALLDLSRPFQSCPEKSLTQQRIIRLFRATGRANEKTDLNLPLTFFTQ